MTRICGIELKASEAVLTILELRDEEILFLDSEPRKIKIGNDELTTEVRSFFDSFTNYIRDNKIQKIVIKKRAKQGQMAGGAVSFKLESLIQLNGIAEVFFVSGQAIAAAQKREPFDLPEKINKYQETAFMAAHLYLRQNKL